MKIGFDTFVPFNMEERPRMYFFLLFSFFFWQSSARAPCNNALTHTCKYATRAHTNGTDAHRGAHRMRDIEKSHKRTVHDVDVAPCHRLSK